MARIRVWTPTLPRERFRLMTPKADIYAHMSEVACAAYTAGGRLFTSVIQRPLYLDNWASSALAVFRSGVSSPSVNQP
jgi:hypothetical protein